MDHRKILEQLPRVPYMVYFGVGRGGLPHLLMVSQNGFTLLLSKCRWNLYIHFYLWKDSVSKSWEAVVQTHSLYNLSLISWGLIPEPPPDTKICGCLSSLYKMAYNQRTSFCILWVSYDAQDTENAM
jgi:hypothetical protein